MARYAGFLSYSRVDEVQAARLARQLEAWRVPRALRAASAAPRLSIFRDVEDAGLGELSEVIRAALAASDALILLCSPAARASGYVALEIESFVEMHGPSRVIPVLVAGRPDAEVGPEDPVQDAAFPAALFAHFDEPLAADLRPRAGEGWFERRRREREAFFQIVAALLGMEKSDELVRRDLNRRRLRAATLGLTTLLATSAAGWAWWDARPRAGLDLRWRIAAPSMAPHEEQALSRLRDSLARELPGKRADRRVLVATWNIRDFLHRPGVRIPRTAADHTYIATVLSHFDVVAVQEMKGKDAEFEPARDALLARLGPRWRYAGTGVTDGRAGNNERLGFFFDTRSASLVDGLDEMVLTPEVMEASGLSRQIARTPTIATLSIDGARLRLANVHIVFGGAGGEPARERAREIEAVLSTLRRRLTRDGEGATPLMLLGDINLQHPEAEPVALAARFGFHFPPELLSAGTSTISDRPYDQILLGWDPHTLPPGVRGAGVLRVFDAVYRLQDLSVHADTVRAAHSRGAGLAAAALERYYRTQWRTRRISDHRPKWIELDLDRVR